MGAVELMDEGTISNGDIRIDVRARNNRLLKRMASVGVSSGTDLARRLGFPQWVGRINELIAMKTPARSHDGSWRDIAVEIADFLDVAPASLFNEQQQWGTIDREALRRSVVKQLRKAEEALPVSVDPETLAFASSRTKDVSMVLATLTPREERTLRMRFGFAAEEMTLEEVGVAFNATRERVRQIEAKALRKLKHPSRSREIRSYLD